MNNIIVELTLQDIRNIVSLAYIASYEGFSNEAEEKSIDKLANIYEKETGEHLLIND